MPLRCLYFPKNVEIDACENEIVPDFAMLDGIYRHPACFDQVREGPQFSRSPSNLNFTFNLWTRKEKKEPPK